MILLRIANYFLNYISIRWLWICLFSGIALLAIGFFGELYIARGRGRELDDQFFEGFIRALVPCLLIPFMIYLIVLTFALLILVLRFRDSVFSYLTGEQEFLSAQIVFPDMKTGPGEEPAYKIKRAWLKVRDRFPYAAHLQVTDKGIYLHGGLMKINRLFKDLRHSQHAHTGMMFFAFEDVSSVRHINTSRRSRYKVQLVNQQSFDLFLPPANDIVDELQFPEFEAKNLQS
jgi:hypothetical protein